MNNKFFLTVASLLISVSSFAQLTGLGDLAADSLNWEYSIEENEDDATTVTKARFANEESTGVDVDLVITLTYVYASDDADTLSWASTAIELVTSHDQFAAKELLGGITVMFDKKPLQSYSYSMDTDDEGLHHITFKNYKQFLSRLTDVKQVTIACTFADDSFIILKYDTESFAIESLQLQTEVVDTPEGEIDDEIDEEIDEETEEEIDEDVEEDVE